MLKKKTYMCTLLHGRREQTTARTFSFKTKMSTFGNWVCIGTCTFVSEKKLFSSEENIFQYNGCTVMKLIWKMANAQVKCPFNYTLRYVYSIPKVGFICEIII